MAQFPNRLPATRATFGYRGRDGFGPDNWKRVHGETATDGTLHTDLKADTSERFVSVEFFARVVDSQYVKWKGSTVRQIDFPRGDDLQPPVICITLNRAEQEAPPLNIKGALWLTLSSTPLGQLVASDLQELIDALDDGLPSAALCLMGKVLDGALRMKGQGDWWNPSWDNRTLGALFREEAVRKAVASDLGEGYLMRLEATSLPLRNIGAHQKATLPTLLEAQSTSAVLVELLNSWFG